MNFILSDDPEIISNLLPFTFTRPIAEIRVGIYTIKEKWENYLQASCSYHTLDYLKEKFPYHIDKENTIINSHILPDPDIVYAVKNLKSGQILHNSDKWIALKTNEPIPDTIFSKNLPETFQTISYEPSVRSIDHNYEIFEKNGEEIKNDFACINKQSQTITDCHTIIYEQHNMFIGENVSCKAAIINAENGPVYIGNDVKIQEGAILQGPLYIGTGTTISMGAKIRGHTSIGPYSKAGGEMNNVVIFGYSNKAHDGFLGNSVIGEWCNLGADTNASNLKNNYGHVKIWNFAKEAFVDTKRQFCGLLMGDHSKTGINTMLNTGTVVGVCANIFGGGFPPKYIPGFSWGGADGFKKYDPEKAYEAASKMMMRRKKDFTEADKKIMHYVYELQK